jgi:hypothetical protein
LNISEPREPSAAIGVGRSSSLNHEPASLLRIDGASWFAFAVGVCNKPEPVAAVRGAKGRSGKAVPLRVIPERGQVSKHSPESSSKESCDVLHDDVAGSKLANESRILCPKTRTVSVDPGSLSGEADVLAGEPAAEDIDVWHRHGHSPDFTFSDVIVLRGPPFIRAFIAKCASGVLPSSCATGVGHKGAHVGIARDSGPMPGKHSPAEIVLLALPHNSHTGPLEAVIEAANPAKERSDIHVASQLTRPQ